MSLLQWASNGWVRPHTTSPQEIGNLLAIVERDLADAEGAISADWRFGIAYNAALKLCTILLHTAGYRADRAIERQVSAKADTSARQDCLSKSTARNQQVSSSRSG
jgi:hypothetical protein